MLYAFMKTPGTYLKSWAPGVELGAVRDGPSLCVSVHSPKAWSGKVVFDYARLNQWPEWWVVDENTLYRVRDAATGKEEIRLGSELKSGYAVTVAPGATRKLMVTPL